MIILFDGRFINLYYKMTVPKVCLSLKGKCCGWFMAASVKDPYLLYFLCHGGSCSREANVTVLFLGTKTSSATLIR